MQNNKLFSNYILNVKIKNEYKELSADEVIDFKKICQRWNEAKGLENEIQHQHNFLQDFFCKILGYTGETGNEENTLWWESGTNDGRRPDGILGFNLKGYKDKDITKGDNINDGDIRVVIELKGANVNLDRNQNRKGLTITPVEQGFLYAPKVGGNCEWVIVSNFKEIRLYKSTEANKYHSFTISELASDDNKIKEFYFLLAKDRLFTIQHLKSAIHDIILDREESRDNIQEDFYSQYKKHRTKLKEHLIEVNKLHERKGFCLHASDKLLRRIIFIVFCQERGLIPCDTLSKYVKDQIYGSKYTHLKNVFHSINIGNNKIKPHIPAFNGGLFKEDKFINELHIEDEEIDRLLFVLNYNFRSELDVEILGHIFEKSISDLQNEAEEDKNDTVKEKNEQEKFGVYYTPSYVTNYIVSEAIGKWLNDKKTEIAKTFDEDSNEFLEEYKNALSSIKVLDPACGSGAFLVEVLDFLLHEWKKLGVDNNYKSILQNNIYGVDINPNSVEITKLSLWLKTAYNKEKLLSLDGNIKIGNSLIEDENIAGRYDEYEGKIIYDNTIIADDMYAEEYKEKQKNQFSKSLAFDWRKEFDFKFDVIVGNPPYIKEDKHREIFEPLNPANKKYKATKKKPAQNKPPFASRYYQGKMDFWQFFACLGLDLLNDNGYLSYIAPSSWITNHGASKTRNKIIQNSQLIRYIDFSDNKVFKAADIQTMIFFLHKTCTEKHEVEYCKLANAEGKLFTHKQVVIADSLQNTTFETIELESANLIDRTIHFVKQEFTPIINKIEKIGTYKLKEDDLGLGIQHSHDVVNKDRQKILGKDFEIGDGMFSITTEEKDALNLTTKELEIVKPEYTTEQIDRYFADNKNTRWTIYTDSSFKKVDKIKDYPNIKKHLDKFVKVITSDNAPYGIHRTRRESLFLGEKIITARKCTHRPRFSFIDFDSYVSGTFAVIKPSDINLKYLTGLLNSKLIAFYLKNKGKMQGSNYQIDIEPLCKIPLAIASDDIQAEIIKKVELMIEINLQLNNLIEDIINYIFESFAKYYKPKTSRDIKEDYETKKTDTDFPSDIQESTRVYEFNTNLAKKIEKNTKLTFVPKVTKLIANWFEYNSSDILYELMKQNVFVPHNDAFTFKSLFDCKKQTCKDFQTQIISLDKEIDAMVYKLYGLTQEEVEIVENNNNN